MKALIWIGCIFLLSLCTVLLRYQGIILGGIPTGLMYAGAIAIARGLCKAWDARKNNKEENKNNEQ